jgi:dTDP-4-dehydrorhamnose reductase
MRLLVTGGQGLLGRALTRRLALAGHAVAAPGHAGLDVTSPAAVADALGELRPERVAHLAAWTDVDGCERDPGRARAVNDEGTRHVAEAAGRAGVPVLYVSTDYVFDGTRPGAYRETDEPAPLSVYGLTKLAGERHVLGFAPGSWVVRCQSVYGAGKKSFVDAVVARARAGEPLRVVTDQRVQPSWAEDLAPALAAVLLAAPPGVYHAANSGSCTWFECARAALEVAGLDVPVTAVVAAELGRPAPRPANSVFSTEKLAQATGVRLPSWRDALARYLSAAPGADAVGAAR